MKISPSRRKYLILAVVSPLVILFDQWTKALIQAHFVLGERKDLLDPVFAFTFVINKGAAFSVMDSAPPQIREPFFLAVPLIALIAIGFVLVRLPVGQLGSATALSLIGGGAIGNLIDRWRLGYVVDFLDVHWKEVYHWPRFNIADSAIVVGVTYLFLLSFLTPKPQGAKS